MRPVSLPRPSLLAAARRCCSPAPALAKLPPLSDEAQAKADEAKAKTAWSDKVAAYEPARRRTGRASYPSGATRKAGQATACTARPVRGDAAPMPLEPPGAFAATAAAAQQPAPRSTEAREGGALGRPVLGAAAGAAGARRLCRVPRMHAPLRLTAARAPLTHASRCSTSTASASRIHIPAERAADAVRRPARAGDADDARRGAGAAGARLPAQPAPGRLARRHRLGHRRLGRERRRGEDARRHRGLRAPHRQARRDHRLRPGHRVRRPDGGARHASRCRRREVGRISQRALYALLDAMRRQESTYKSAGSVHGCALFRGATSCGWIRRGRRPPQRHRHHRRLDVAARASRRRQDLLHHRPPDQRDGDEVGPDGRADHRLAHRHHADGPRAGTGSAWRCSAARRTAISSATAASSASIRAGAGRRAPGVAALR